MNSDLDFFFMKQVGDPLPSFLPDVTRRLKFGEMRSYDIQIYEYRSTFVFRNIIKDRWGFDAVKGRYSNTVAADVHMYNENKHMISEENSDNKYFICYKLELSNEEKIRLRKKLEGISRINVITIISFIVTVLSLAMALYFGNTCESDTINNYHYHGDQYEQGE